MEVALDTCGVKFAFGPSHEMIIKWLEEGDGQKRKGGTVTETF